MGKSNGAVRHLVLWLVLAVVSVAITVVAFFPATWIAALVEKYSAGRLSLGDVQGTLWSGSAFIGAASNGSDPITPLLPGRFAWHLSPLILLGRTDATVENPAALSQPIQIRGGWRQWQVSAAALTLPAERLAGLGAPLNTLRPSGQMQLSWSKLDLVRQTDKVEVIGTTTLDLNDIASRLSPIKPLGSYQLGFQWQGAQARMMLHTVKGPLMLKGAGMLNDGRLQFSGTAEAAPGQEEKLANLLNLLGQRRLQDGKNVIALEFK